MTGAVYNLALFLLRAFFQSAMISHQCGQISTNDTNPRAALLGNIEESTKENVPSPAPSSEKCAPLVMKGSIHVDMINMDRPAPVLPAVRSEPCFL